MKASQPLIREDPLRDKSPPEVDVIIGKKHSTPETAVDWSECKLALKYPQWEKFFEALWEERELAKKEGRAPRWAAAPPKKKYCQPKDELAPWEKGPTVGQMKRLLK